MKHFNRSIVLIILLSCSFTLLFSQSITHIVQKSETLYSLGRKYGVSVEKIRSANDMGTSNAISIGQKLIIPEQGSTQSTVNPLIENIETYDTYRVLAGDTLYSISRKNGLTVDELRSLNGSNFSSDLKIGQELKVPAQQISSTTTKPSTPNTSLPTIDSSEDPREVSSRPGDTSLVWPVKASEVAYVAGKISGVALTGAQNEKVNAIRSGTVMFSGIYRGFGQVAFVQATTGHIYVYTGLDSLSVAKGQYIQYGQELGRIGSDTLSGTYRMNFMVFHDGDPIDPAKAPRG